MFRSSELGRNRPVGVNLTSARKERENSANGGKNEMEKGRRQDRMFPRGQLKRMVKMPDDAR